MGRRREALRRETGVGAYGKAVSDAASNFVARGFRGLRLLNWGLTSSPDDEVGHRKASQQPLRAVGETVRVKKMSCAHGKPAIGSAQDRRLP